MNNDFVGYLATLSVPPEVAKLYMAVMEDIFAEKEGDRKKDVAKLDGELLGIETKLLRADEKYVEGDLDRDSYHRLKDSYVRQRDGIEQRKAEIEGTDSNFMKYVRYGLSLVANLPHYYNDAPVEVKQKLIGLIFPEKLTYENGKYRTTKLNDVIALLQNKISDSDPSKRRTDALLQTSVSFGTPNGIRTRATTVKGWRPNH